MAATILHFRLPARERPYARLDGEVQALVRAWLKNTLLELALHASPDALAYGDKALLRKTIETLDALEEPQSITLKKMLWSMEALLGLRNRLLAQA